MFNDLIIIGGGPAGLTAAIYAGRAGIKPVVFEAFACGGQVLTTTEIENYPGIVKTEGWRFAEELRRQAEEFGTQIKSKKVIGFSVSDSVRTVVTEDGSYDAGAVIIANGVHRRKLNCPGETEFTGRGVSYCGVCDGNFFRGKTVCVIGGGESAYEDALYLSGICEKVYLIYRRAEFRVKTRALDEVLARENIVPLLGKNPARIIGENRVTGVELADTAGGETETITTDAVFVAIGLEPDNSIFSDCIALDDAGYIAAGEDCRTSVPGVFAAGDTRVKHLRQIITAASDGAVAATAAVEYLGSLNK